MVKVFRIFLPDFKVANRSIHIEVVRQHGVLPQATPLTDRRKMADRVQSPGRAQSCRRQGR